MYTDKLVKVIKGIDICNHGSCSQCPYVDDGEYDKCLHQLIADRKEMLDEQESYYVGLVREWWGLVCVCPDCKAEWMSDKDDTHFCPKCGRAVKWE